MSDVDALHLGLEKIKQSFSELEASLITNTDLSDDEKAYGYRFLFGLHKWVADRYFIGSDRQRPRFVKYGDELSRWGLANADNAYWIAEIAPDTEYLIHGHRGTCADYCLEVRTGIGRQEDGTHSTTVSYLDAGNLRVGADGRFTVCIGGEPGADNHLATRHDASVVFVRQTFGDWDTEEVGPFWIEKAGPALPPAPTPSPEDIAAQLEDIARFLTFLGKVNLVQAGEFAATYPVNTFAPPAVGQTNKSKGGFFPGQYNLLARFQIEDDEALIVSLTPPECRYLGFSLGRHHWFAPLDFENRQTSLNAAQAKISTDGRLHYVISPDDPGVFNWIDTSGLTSGFMFFRCQGLTGDFAHPTVTVVKRSQVRQALPNDEPVISRDQRNEVLKRRRAATHRRFF